MRHTLFHIYGPFSIHSFGLMIALGLLAFSWLVARHPLRKKIVSCPAFIDTIVVGIIAAAFGGRLLYVMSEWNCLDHWSSLLNFWEGGFSILGSIVGTLIILPWYLKRHAIAVVPFFDLIALHVPLLQAISRIGCFFAGCCYGITTAQPWSVFYTDCESIAPLGVNLHPTQLYSACMLFSIFIFLYYIAQPVCTKQGQMSCLYLMLISLERFFLDFYRGDQTYLTSSTFQLFSVNQWVALVLFLSAALGLMYASLRHHTNSVEIK